MFPVLFEIPDAWSMPGASLVMEVLVGLACLLAWLALHIRARRGWLVAMLNLVAVLVALHLALSHWMEGSITIFSFGVVIVLAFFLGSAFLVRQTRPLGIEDRSVFDWAFWMLVTGIIGSRLLFAFLEYDHFRENKLEILRIWNGGLVWYGGLIPAALVGIWLLRRHRLPVLHVADAGAAAVMLALGLGRWACLLAGDDYGRPTDAWFGIRFHDEQALVASGLHGVPLHPTQLYMSVNCLWIFFLVEWIRRRARLAGQAFAWMLILYAVTRAVLIEPFRGDFVERNPGYKRRAAVTVLIEKAEASPPVTLERGARITGTQDRKGVLLEGLELPAGKAAGSVHALSAEPFPDLDLVLLRQDWSIRSIEGLPAEVVVSSRSVRRYDSDLPVPPGYVSTSQWISVFVVLAGVGLLVLSRRLGVEGYDPAVARVRASRP